MAKVESESTSWLSLCKARARALRESGSSLTLAGKLIIEAIIAGTPSVDWRYKRAQNVTSLTEFWKNESLVVDWEDNSAKRLEVLPAEARGMGTLYAVLLGVELNASYLDRFLAPKTDEWLCATCDGILAAGGSNHKLGSLAKIIRPLMIEAAATGANIQVFEESTLVKELSRLGYARKFYRPRTTEK